MEKLYVRVQGSIKMLTTSCLFFSNHLQQQISARDQRLTRMVCLICVGYGLCSAPLTAMFFLDANTGVGGRWWIRVARLAAENIFLLQYSFNFVVYAASNKQYREAYKLLFERLSGCCHASKQGEEKPAPFLLREELPPQERGHVMVIASGSSSTQQNGLSEEDASFYALT